VHDLATLYDSQPSHFEGFTQIVLPGECEFFSHFYWRGKKYLAIYIKAYILDTLDKEANYQCFLVS